jgi:DNA-binding NarL/FixJ family response regulator
MRSRCLGHILSIRRGDGSLQGQWPGATSGMSRFLARSQRLGMTRILIADGSDVVRRLLKLLIESREGWVVCGEVTDGLQAVRKSAELKPDVIVMDLAMEGLNGLLAAREILKILPNASIFLHTVNNIPAVVAEAKKFGIRRVLGKGLDGDLLLNAIQEELDAKPQGVASLLEEAAPQVNSGEQSEAADGSEDAPPKVN